MEKRLLEQEIQQSNVSLNLYDLKAAKIEDQVISSCFKSHFRCKLGIDFVYLIFSCGFAPIKFKDLQTISFEVPPLWKIHKESCRILNHHLSRSGIQWWNCNLKLVVVG